MSTLKITKMLVPSNKYGVKSPYKMTPKYVVIHNTANDASAKAEVSYMVGNNNQVSFHYAVDHNRAVQGVPLNRNAWHAGDGAKGEGNRYGIAIEICYSKSGGDKFIKAQENASYLSATLLKKYGLPISRLKKHQDFSGKYCPHRTLQETGWTVFKAMVKAHLDELNGVKKTVKVEDAMSKDSSASKGKRFVTTDELNLRYGAGVNKKLIKALPKGTAVMWYGYYTSVSGVRWYLIQVVGSKETGFVSSPYLKAV